jgi:hypothetical protein
LFRVKIVVILHRGIGCFHPFFKEGLPVEISKPDVLFGFIGSVQTKTVGRLTLKALKDV